MAYLHVTHLFEPSLVQSFDQILFIFQGNSLLLLERKSPRLRIPMQLMLHLELFVLEEALLKGQISRFHSRCDTRRKRVKSWTFLHRIQHVPN